MKPPALESVFPIPPALRAVQNQAAAQGSKSLLQARCAGTNALAGVYPSAVNKILGLFGWAGCQAPSRTTAHSC